VGKLLHSNSTLRTAAAACYCCLLLLLPLLLLLATAATAAAAAAAARAVNKYIVETHCTAVRETPNSVYNLGTLAFNEEARTTQLK
jgi:hypothetical protein